jgi:hypothetical protein
MRSTAEAKLPPSGGVGVQQMGEKIDKADLAQRQKILWCFENADFAIVTTRLSCKM